MSDKPQVQSFNAKDDKGRTVRFTIGTDIIDYAESARAFGREDLAAADAQGRFQKRMFAFPDRKSSVVSPMVLSIGNQNGLSLIRRQDGADSTAWKLTDLTGAFTAVGANPQVRAMGVGWTDDDRVTIAVAVDGHGGGTGERPPSRVFVAWNVSTKTTDWSKIPWVDCGTREKVTVAGIRVVEESEGEWTVVLSGDRGADGTLYLLRSGRRPHSFASALVFTPAVTFQEIFDFQACVDEIVGAGVAFVGRSGSSSVLAFRPFPRYNKEGKISNTPPAVPLPCPAGARLLHPGVTRNEKSDLYISGAGVQLIPAEQFDQLDDATITSVASPEAMPDVMSMVAVDAEDGSAAVWTVLRNGDLGVARRKAGEKKWGNPLRLRAGVQDIAAVQGDDRTTTSLLVVYRDGKSTFLWQDAASGGWQETPLLVANPDKISKATCYGTSLRLLSETGSPRAGAKVTVSASVLANVVVNRQSAFLGPDLKFETTTDSNGAVAIFDRVRSLTPAIYRFRVEGIAESIDVNPAGGIHKRFSEMSADQLRSASVTAPNGVSTPLLSERFRTGDKKNQMDAVAGSLTQAAGLTKGTNGIAGGVCLAPKGAAFSSALKLATLPANYRWGIEADAKGVRAASSAVIDSLTNAAKSAGQFFVNLGESIGDFFEGIWSRIKEGWTFVVEKTVQGINFICKLGEKVANWVLKTLEEIGSFFVWLWEQVETALEKLWEWLKFVFDWKDIVRVRDAMVGMTEQALTYFENSIGGMKPTIESGFNDLSKIIRGWAGETAGPPPPSGIGSSFTGTAMTVMGAVSSVMDQIMGNSVVAWVFGKIQSLFDYILRIEMPEMTSAMTQAVDGLQRLLAGSIGSFAELGVAIARGFEQVLGKAVDINNVSLDGLKRAMVAAGLDVIDSAMNVFKGLVIGALDLMKNLVAVGRALLKAKMRFPLIEQIVNTLTMGMVSVDTTFRMIDGLVLLCAIPTTIAFKIMTGRAPLRGASELVFPFGKVAVSNAAEDMVSLLTIWGPVLACVGKIMATAYDMPIAMTETPHWHTVSIPSAALAIVGFGAEIASMSFGGDTATVALQSTMTVATGIATCFAISAAVQRKDNDEARLTASQILGFTQCASGLVHLGLRGGVHRIAKNKGMTQGRELAMIASFMEDFAVFEDSPARLARDVDHRLNCIRLGLAGRLASLGVGVAGAYYSLQEAGIA
jgi:hypothetical protein